MVVNTTALVSITEANQNFSKVVRLVDEQGMAVILKNNKPKYVLVDYSEYDMIQAQRTAKIEMMADSIISKNLEAFKELAK